MVLRFTIHFFSWVLRGPYIQLFFQRGVGADPGELGVQELGLELSTRSLPHCLLLGMYRDLFCFRVKGLGLRVYAWWFRVEGLGIRVWG